MVRMVPALSSRSPLVAPVSPEMMEVLEAETEKYGETSRTPPITSDPPRHRPYRRLIMPFFSPHAVEGHIPYTRALCNGLIDGFIGKGRADAAADYAQQIAPRVIAHILGIDPGRAGDFVTWVRGMLEFGLTDPAADAEIPDRHPRVLPGNGDRAPRGAPRRRDLGADRLRGGGREARRLQDRRHVPAAAGRRASTRPGARFPPRCCISRRTTTTGRGCRPSRNCCRWRWRSCCASIRRSPWAAS